MKKIQLFVSTVIITAASILSVKSAFAVVETSVKVREAETKNVLVTNSPSPKTAISIKPLKRAEIKVELKKTNAVKEIDRRLESLNKLSLKINLIKRITAVQRETYLAQIQLEIKNLSDLKTKIQSETDATALIAEKKTITENYRIYALFIPKIEIMAHADKIMEVADAMSSKTSDSVQLAKIAEAKAKAQSAIDLVVPLSPEQFPGFKSNFSKARDLLKEARTTLNSVFSVIKANQSQPNDTN